MFDINDYYLGFIMPTIDYYKKHINKRYVGDILFDPFDYANPLTSLIVGNVVLLRKDNDKYIDEEYSMYDNELKYKLDEENNIGIKLCFVRPFSDYYTEDVNTYILEDAEGNEEMMEEMVTHSYYVVHSKLTKKDALIINVPELKDDVRTDYFNPSQNTKTYIKTEKNSV